MTREEHLQWCKDRATEYLPDDPAQAVASMCSDMRKHEELDSPAVLMLSAVGMMEIRNGHAAVRRWIEGFN